MKGYNGWKNHATWAASMWITELGFDFTTDGVYAFKEYLESICDEITSRYYFIADFICIDEISWDELVEAANEGEEEEDEEDCLED